MQLSGRAVDSELSNQRLNGSCRKAGCKRLRKKWYVVAINGQVQANIQYLSVDITDVELLGANVFSMGIKSRLVSS